MYFPEGLEDSPFQGLTSLGPLFTESAHSAQRLLKNKECVKKHAEKSNLVHALV
jgi:hypothetical protein